jgi:hypothetical protein
MFIIHYNKAAYAGKSDRALSQHPASFFKRACSAAQFGSLDIISNYGKIKMRSRMSSENRLSPLGNVHVRSDEARLPK